MLHSNRRPCHALRWTRGLATCSTPMDTVELHDVGQLGQARRAADSTALDLDQPAVRVLGQLDAQVRRLLVAARRLAEQVACGATRETVSRELEQTYIIKRSCPFK